MKKIAILYKKLSKDEIEFLHIYKCDNNEEFQNEYNKMYNNVLSKKENFKEADEEPLYFEVKYLSEKDNLSCVNRVLFFSPSISLEELKIKKYVTYNIKWANKGLPDHLIFFIEEPNIDFVDEKYKEQIHNDYIKKHIENDLTRMFGFSPKEFEFSDLETYEEMSFNSYMNFNKLGGANE